MDNLLLKMGKRLHARRKQLRMTQEELAERAEMTTQTVSTAETGKKALRPENIVKLCSALDISTDYLLLGRVGMVDYNILAQKISQLDAAQYRYLEDMINAYIAALKERE